MEDLLTEIADETLNTLEKVFDAVGGGEYHFLMCQFLAYKLGGYIEMMEDPDANEEAIIDQIQRGRDDFVEVQVH